MAVGIGVGVIVGIGVGVAGGIFVGVGTVSTVGVAVGIAVGVDPADFSLEGESGTGEETAGGVSEAELHPNRNPNSANNAVTIAIRKAVLDPTFSK